MKTGYNYRVNVTRTIREDANVYVVAKNPEEATKKAYLEAQENSDKYDWDRFDIHHRIRKDDVEEI